FEFTIRTHDASASWRTGSGFESGCGSATTVARISPNIAQPPLLDFSSSLRAVNFGTTGTFHYYATRAATISEYAVLFLWGTSATMRRSAAIIGLLTAALGSGCSLFTNGARNLCNEPSLAWEEFRFGRRARLLARESWAARPDRQS